MENGLILMGDLPRKNGLIVMGDLPKWKRGRIKRAKKQLKQGFGKKIFLFLLLSIFKQT